MEVSEEGLALRLKERDPAALEILMDAYGSNVYHLVRRILGMYGSKEDIEECVSDVFITVWNKIAEHDPNRGSLKTWVHILAKYNALDCRRRLAGRPRFEAINLELKNNENTENSVMLKIEINEILQIVDSFDLLDRSIFYKKYFYYESLETVAQVLGLTRKAVENRLRRVRIALKQRLIPEMKEELL